MSNEGSVPLGDILQNVGGAGTEEDVNVVDEPDGPIEGDDGEVLVIEDVDANILARRYYDLSKQLGPKCGLPGNGPAFEELGSGPQMLMGMVFERLLEENDALRTPEAPAPAAVKFEAGEAVPAEAFARAAERMLAAISVNYSPARVRAMASMLEAELGLSIEGEVPEEKVPSEPCDLVLMPGVNWAKDECIGFYVDANGKCLGFRLVGGRLLAPNQPHAQKYVQRLPASVRV